VQQKVVTVHDQLQQDYRYNLVKPIGRDFDPEFYIAARGSAKPSCTGHMTAVNSNSARSGHAPVASGPYSRSPRSQCFDLCNVAADCFPAFYLTRVVVGAPAIW
jgi:hypothetical protein